MTERRINILQIVEGFGWGGAEKKLLELIKCMNHKLFNTVVCSLGLSDHISKEFQNSNIKIVTIGRRSRFDLGVIRKVARLMKEEKIDIVMTTLFYADIIGAFAGKIAGVKAIFSWETISAPEWLIKRRLLPYRFAVHYIDRVIAVSNSTARFLIEKRGVPSDKVTVIPYGVDMKKYNTGKNERFRCELGIRDDEIVIGVVGRLHPQKGHVYLIRSAQNILSECKNIRFVFAGDGDLREELERMIKANGMDKYFIFLGYREDIPDVLKAFDIFVLPSLYEGLPNVILEAMATGKPVVATDVDGSKEAVLDGVTGYLVPKRDTGKLSEKLIELIKDMERARMMGLEGRRRVERYFSLDNQIDSFERLFKSIIDKK